MSDFFKKSKGSEAKHVQASEHEFKIMARRNKLAGMWAAELLGLIGHAAIDYAKHVVHADLEEKGDEDVVRKLAGDLEGKASHSEIREKLAHFLHIARKEVDEGHK